MEITRRNEEWFYGEYENYTVQFKFAEASTLEIGVVVIRDITKDNTIAMFWYRDLWVIPVTAKHAHAVQYIKECVFAKLREEREKLWTLCRSADHASCN